MAQESSSKRTILIAVAVAVVIVIALVLMRPSEKSEQPPSAAPSEERADRATPGRPAAGQPDRSSAGRQDRTAGRPSQRPQPDGGALPGAGRTSSTTEADRASWPGGIPPEIAEAVKRHTVQMPPEVEQAHRSRQEVPPEIWESFENTGGIPPDIAEAHQNRGPVPPEILRSMEEAEQTGTSADLRAAMDPANQ